MVEKILITGSSGFVGKNLIEFYADKYQVVVLSKQDDLSSILKYHRPQTIINAAASIYDYPSMFYSNVFLVNSLIEYVKETGSRLIQIGSSAEYGKKAFATKEIDSLEPVTFYAGTKAAATLMCSSAAMEFNLPIIIARPYSLYGNYEKPYRLFSKLYEAFVNNAEMVLTEAYHDFIYIKDFIRGLDKLITSTDWICGDIINFGSGVQTSNTEVLDEFIKIFGSKPNCIVLDKESSKPFESRIWLCDTMYAKDQYGFVTEYSLSDGIKDLIKIKGQIK